MPHDILVSIINYRTGDLTLNCVASVLEDIGTLDVLIVLVDNNSEDGSAEQIANWIAAQPENIPVRLIRSSTNSGFSGGHNQGIAAAEASYYLVLNSDAVLKPGFLKKILETARANPDTGFIAPIIERDHGAVQDSCFRFHSPQSELVRAARSSIVTRAFKRYDVSLGSDPDPGEIRWASFACILINGTMVRQIGPMDEGYFLYFEDVEYCLRAYRAGWNILQEREARAIHFRGGSGPVKELYIQRARLPRYYYSSRTRFLYQAYGMTGLITANLLWYCGRAIKNLTRLTGRRIAPMTKAEGRDIWTNVTQPLKPSFAPGDSE